jgi:spermidine synthase
MRFARCLLIFSYGLFTIAAQTLLFREFITTFEGNDISVGIFFSSWFLWVGLGAILIYRVRTLAEKLLKNIEFLFLAYLPAFVIQLILIIQARELAGIEPYALWPIRAILLLSIIVNAPLSVITGMLFPIACRWVQSDQKLAVSRVYIIEAAGSFVGGLGVTILLGLGVSLAKVFFILAFVLSSSVSCVRLAKAKQYSKLKIRTQPVLLLPLCILLCLAVGADKALMRYVRTVKWTKLLPADALTGSFQTAQAEYLYGVYHDQWVAVREGSVCEALPDESTAGQIAAISLCQNPDAKRVLVIGSGLGLCRELLKLPQIETISWAHCDNEYVQEVNKFIPPQLKITDKRFHRLAGDVRSLLAKKRQY